MVNDYVSDESIFSVIHLSVCNYITLEALHKSIFIVLLKFFPISPLPNCAYPSSPELDLKTRFII